MERQRILIAGGSGLLGKALIKIIDYTKYEVIILSRSPKTSSDTLIQHVSWDTDHQTIDLDFVPDHIINLAGAGIADKRWTAERKQEMIDSRVKSAQTIEKFLENFATKPKTYISASAIGYYGDRDADILTETSAIGQGFLSECCQAWEASAIKTGRQCAQTVILRIGIVISELGGALPKMLMTKRIGLYNYFGDGKQYYSWIHIDDLCQMIIQSLENKDIQGIYNAAAPSPMTYRAFLSSYMGATNSKGILTSIPKFMIKIIMGEMSHIVLDSARVSADKWIKIGFVFAYPKTPFIRG